MPADANLPPFPRAPTAARALEAGAEGCRHEQAQVAERLGVPQSYIAKVEGGERRLDVIEFIHLMQVMGVDLAGIIADIAGTLVAQTPASIEQVGTCDTAE